MKGKIVSGPFSVYPVESLPIYGEDEEKNVHSLLRVGFKAPAFSNGVH